MPAIFYNQVPPPLPDVLRLLRQTDWAVNRPEYVVEKSLRHSVCITGWDGDYPVCMARIITDYATYGYLADVVVDEAYRGRGISKAMMAYIMYLDFVKDLRRFCLITGDAHELYRRYGFGPMERPTRYLEIFKTDNKPH